VHVSDLMPTLLDAAGVAYDAGALYGRSILPVLAGETTETRGADESFGGEVSGNASLYRGNWKLVRTALPRGDFTWRLYDLSVDPGETTDLSSENPELFAEMRAEYEAYAAETGVSTSDARITPKRSCSRTCWSGLIGKYWPHLAGLVAGAAHRPLRLFRLVRMVVRRPAH
jgi:arylsulfatase A-like enzyme